MMKNETISSNNKKKIRITTLDISSKHIIESPSIPVT